MEPPYTFRIKNILQIFFAFLQVSLTEGSSSPMCTHLKHFEHLIRRDRVSNNTFKIVKNVGFLGCVQQCLFRANCVSVNFYVSSNICGLNQEGDNQSILFKNGSLFSEIKKWPQRLALLCENHSCRKGTSCVIRDGKTTACVEDVSPLDKGYVLATTSTPFFYKVYRKPQNFSQTLEVCGKDKGQLIELKTDEKNSYIKNIIEDIPAKCVFIAATDKEKEGTWRWYSSNENVAFSDWSKGEPNDYRGREDCSVLWKDHDWKWNDLPCDSTCIFICELI